MDAIRINEETLSDIVILSNTPSFLFRRFRRDNSVQMLAERLNELELAAAAQQYGLRADRSFLDKVYAYAYIVALSFKAASAIRNAIEKMPTPPIQWALELINQAIAQAASETRKVVSYTAKPLILSSTAAQVSTTRAAIIEGTTPVLKTAQPVLSHNVVKVIHLD